PAAVIENGTLDDQRVVTTPLGRLAETTARAGIASPFLVVVGDVVSAAEHISWFDPGRSLRNAVRIATPFPQRTS
ncbi:MAG: siroheme synthase, partial [Actinomycetota bacterium]|nr:siroheme synthase [Actinomycetota bacterium]